MVGAFNLIIPKQKSKQKHGESKGNHEELVVMITSALGRPKVLSQHPGPFR